MQAERLNRLSFFFFMGTLGFSLVLILFLSGKAQYEEWFPREERVMTLYIEPALQPLLEAEVEAFREQSDIAVRRQELPPAADVAELLKQHGTVLIQPEGLSASQGAALTTAGVHFRAEMVKMPPEQGAFHLLFAGNNEKVADQFLRFLRSAAGQEVAVKYRSIKKAPTG